MKVMSANSTTCCPAAVLPGASLVVCNGKRAGETVVLPGGTSLLGADPSCTVALAGVGISAAHALVLVGTERTIIRSLSGDTWCNGRPIDEAQLRHGDLLTLGRLELQYLERDSAIKAGLAEEVSQPATPVGQAIQRSPRTIDLVMLARIAQADDDSRRLKRTARQLRRRERNLRSLAFELQRRSQAQSRWIAMREADLAATLDGWRELAADKSETAVAATQQAESPPSPAESTCQQAETREEREKWAAQWSLAQTQLAERMQQVTAELAQLRLRQVELCQAQPVSAEQQVALEFIAARCAALEQASATVPAELLRLEAVCEATHADYRNGYDQLQQQIASLHQQLECLSQTPPPEKQALSEEFRREEHSTVAQRHSIEDRLAGLRAEREAFEDQQRKERAEQALSRHLGLLTHESDPTVEEYEQTSATLIAQPETAASQAESSITPPRLAEDQYLPESFETRFQPSIVTVPPLAESPATAPPISALPPVADTSDESRPPTESPPTDGQSADPFERLTRLLQKDGAPAHLASRGEHPAIDHRPPIQSVQPPSPVEPKPAPKAPESAAELLRRLGHDLKLQDDEPTSRSVGIAPSRRANPADEPAVVLGTSDSLRSQQTTLASKSAEKPKQVAEDDTIDDYMARLLQRVRSVSNEAKNESPARKQESNSYSQPERQPDRTVQPQKTSEEADLERRKQEYVRRAAPESSHDLKNLREVANMQARQAIDTHARKRLTDVRGSKLLVACLALGLSVALAGLKGLGYIDSYLGIAGGAVVALLWGLQYLSIMLRTKNHSASKSPAKPTAVESPTPHTSP